MIAAAELNRRVTIEQPVETRDPTFGAVTRTWNPVATVWAAVEPLSGRQIERQRELGSEVTLRVRTRMSSLVAGVTPKMRITHGAKRYEIDSVINPAEARDELIMMCTEYRHG